MKKSRWISAAIVAAGMLGCIGVGYLQEREGVFAGHDFILQAHRGLSGRYPENTAVSFLAAAGCSEFQGIETDVQETADGILVLYHDRDISKKTDALGAIGDYTLEQVQKIHIVKGSNIEKYPDERIPLLEDYLTICRESGKIPYIELKSLTEAGMGKLIAALDEGGWQDKCVITSFHKDLIEMFRSINTSYPIEYMIDEKTEYDISEVVTYLSQYENMAFRPNAYVVTKKDVAYCSKQGIRVECFGLDVGDKKRLEKLKSMGVKGVTCNDYEGL